MDSISHVASEISWMLTCCKELYLVQIMFNIAFFFSSRFAPICSYYIVYSVLNMVCFAV